MYEQYYGLKAKPFQLKPDPKFYFGSKGHKRAMAYLEYGLSQGEGFIVITGEVGAGKTTLVRNLFREMESENIVAAQIVNTNLDSDDTLRMVAAAFGLPYQDSSKAALLTGLEQFLRACDRQGKRALLVVDEAQNLSPRTVEELRMLSNFQTEDKSLLQTFLLGQPEFRRTLLSADMQQLRQRVIATYHLGPMDATETRSYIEHRLHTVGWQGDPSISTEAFGAIYDYSGGIPRKINTLCDRLFLMGYLEEIHGFGNSEVSDVIGDIQQEFNLPASEAESPGTPSTPEFGFKTETPSDLDSMDKRLSKMEKSVISVLDLVKQILSLASVRNLPK
ncbi:ATPase [Sulfurimicrobium lacus]|uniref:ATPase n=1 Tax=Sulfurimicrobium lacus TaxID=2715678 RepID=A0A6F8VCY4_9PROT|nr:XrtA/PEP-CTERM system-associated ATPase [Sulfurimicrobium lacus]BCB26599.1 ATPase [Sulfurimicrobium lacus]